MKLKYALIFPSMFIAFAGTAQTNPKAAATANVYTYVEQMPEAGYDYKEYIGGHIHYPDSARVHEIQGRVIVRFIINEDGSISNCTIAQGVNHYIDDEALRVVRSFPRWKPGKQNGKPVKVYFTLPILFRLAD